MRNFVLKNLLLEVFWEPQFSRVWDHILSQLRFLKKITRKFHDPGARSDGSALLVIIDII